MERQRPNVQRMRLLGAEVRPALTGRRTLKDATSEAIRDWVANVETTHYIIGSAVGPHPYPAMVARLPGRDRREAREQILERGRPAARATRWPASAAAATPSACSAPSSTTPR